MYGYLQTDYVEVFEKKNNSEHSKDQVKTSSVVSETTVRVQEITDGRSTNKNLESDTISINPKSRQIKKKDHIQYKLPGT